MDQNAYELIKKAVLNTIREKGGKNIEYEAASIFKLGEKAINEENRRIEQEEQEKQNAKEIEPFSQKNMAEIAAKSRII